MTSLQYLLAAHDPDGVLINKGLKGGLVVYGIYLRGVQEGKLLRCKKGVKADKGVWCLFGGKG